MGVSPMLVFFGELMDLLPRHPADSPRFPAEVYLQRITVPFEYPVCFTRHLFAPENPLLADVLDRRQEGRRHRAAVFIDAGVAAAWPELVKQVKAYFHDRPAALELAGEPSIVPGGEEVKRGWEAVRDVMWTLGNLHLDRQSFVIAIGGGSVLDMVGFAASIVHRGLRLVRVPTTTLAQNDAGVGVKNGMNEHGMKNFVGTFAPPWAVLDDFEFLRTLPAAEWIGGVAEAFKVAIIKDAAFFDCLCEHAAGLARRDEAAMAKAVRRCAVLHLEHIASGGDPFEFGSARPLDFGHWVGHRLETLSDYALGHGQSCAVGIALDSYYAMRKGLISAAELERILTGLSACGLPIWDDRLATRTGEGRTAEGQTGEGELAILKGLADFREHLGGRLTITLPRGIGRSVEVHEMDAAVIAEGVAWLAARVAPADPWAIEEEERTRTTRKKDGLHG